MILLALIPFILALWLPEAAVALIAAALPAYQIRFVLFGVPTTLLELGLYGLAVGMVVRCLLRRELRQSPVAGWRSLAAYRGPLLGVLLVAALSALYAIGLRSGLGALKAWYFDAALFLAVVALLGKTAQPWLLVGLASGSSVVSLYGLWEYFFRHAVLLDGRLNSVFETANYHALLFVPIIVLLVSYGLAERRWRWPVIAAAAVNALALLLTFSYGGYLGLAAGLVAVALVALSRQQRRRTLLALAAVSAALLLALSGTDKFRRLTDLTNRSSSHVRAEVWRTSWYIIQRHPWLGVGPGNFEPAYREAVPHVVFPPLEWLVALPHSLPLALLAQTGILGFASFVWLLVVFFRTAWRLPRPQAAAMIGAMVAILAHGLVDTPYFKNDLAPLFMALVALTLTGRDSQAESPPTNGA